MSSTHATRVFTFRQSDYSGYEDAQSALSEVGPGDVAHLDGVWNVWKYGPWHFQHPVHVRGNGYSLPSTTSNQYGSIFNNLDQDNDVPSVMMEGQPISSSWNKGSVSGLHFWNAAPTRFCIEASNIYNLHIHDVNIKCDMDGYGGVGIRDGCFFLKMDRVQASNFAGRGIEIIKGARGAGSMYVMEDCNAFSNHDDADCGIHSEMTDTLIYRGQQDTRNGTGIRLLNTPDASGILMHTYHESGAVGIEVIGGRDVQIIAPHFSLRDPENIRLGMMIDTECALIDNPRVVNWDHKGDLIRFRENSHNCTVRHDTRQIAHKIVDMGTGNRIVCQS